MSAQMCSPNVQGCKRYPTVFLTISTQLPHSWSRSSGGFLKSYKRKRALHIPPPSWKLWTCCRLSWRCDKLIFHLNAHCSEHWCKGYYPECPSGLANNAKGAYRGNSKKWSADENKIYLLLYIKHSTVAQVISIVREDCFIAAFHSCRWQSTF